MTSKGQDIVDSWEEIDEERLASRLNNLTSDESAKSSEEATVNGTSSGPTSSISLPAMLEEELRPRMILQRPQMQILRRPQANVQEEKTTAESKPKTQIKSLDQRKQAYAEARLRILGSAHDEEEQQQKQIEQVKKGSPNTNGYRINNNVINNNSGSVRLDRPQSSYRPAPGNFHIQQHQPQHTPGPYYSPHSSGRNQLPPEAAAAAASHHYYQQQQQQQQQQQAPHPPGPGAYFQQLQQHHQPQHHHHQKQMAPYGMSPHSSSSSYHHGSGPIAAGYGQVGGHNSNNNVLRLPAGPDGSHGFTMRR